ncbi:hypothetical protein ONS96_014815 [Cadophora gregata f. sp. sojae]|nr:hypothetical protein ONS96_014815 [Cadophora gregata f. sp. sojae]
MRNPLLATDYLPDDWRESMHPHCHGRVILTVIEELDAYIKTQPMWESLEEAHEQILEGLAQTSPIEDDDQWGNERDHAHYWAGEIFMRICKSQIAIDSGADHIRQGIQDIILEQDLQPELDDDPWDAELPLGNPNSHWFTRYKALIDSNDTSVIFLFIETLQRPVGQPSLNEAYEFITPTIYCTGNLRKLYDWTEIEDEMDDRTGIEIALIDPPCNRRTEIEPSSEQIIQMPKIPSDSFVDRVMLRLWNWKGRIDLYVKIPGYKVMELLSAAKDQVRQAKREIKEKPLNPPSWIGNHLPDVKHRTRSDSQNSSLSHTNALSGLFSDEGNSGEED